MNKADMIPIALFALARAECVKDATTTPVTFHCPLCNEGQTHLSGEGVHWYVGGGGDANQNYNTMAVCDPTIKTRLVYKVATGAVIEQGSDPNFELQGTLQLVGSNVTVDGAKLRNSISIVGPDALGINIRNVAVSNDNVAVRAYRGNPLGPLLDVSDLVITNAQSTIGEGRQKYALAIAHTTDSYVQVSCDGVTNRVLSQPAVPMTNMLTPGCLVTDLGEILSVYGETYEISFYNWNFEDPSPLLETLIKWFALVDATLLILLGTCHQSSASSVRERAI